MGEGLQESHYTPEEEAEILQNWGNALSERNPKLAEAIVRDIVEVEFPSTTSSEADTMTDMTTFINWANEQCITDRQAIERHIPMMVYSTFGSIETPPENLVRKKRPRSNR